MTVPPVTFAVSNTPSPTVNPWSKTDTLASPSTGTAPSIQTVIGASPSYVVTAAVCPNEWTQQRAGSLPSARSPATPVADQTPR